MPAEEETVKIEQPTEGQNEQKNQTSEDHSTMQNDPAPRILSYRETQFFVRNFLDEIEAEAQLNVLSSSRESNKKRAAPSQQVQATQQEPDKTENND